MTDKFTGKIKLFIYSASGSDLALIVRRYLKTWELIQWDTKNDTFVHGQWLLKSHYRLWLPGSSLSPNGKMFYYQLDEYGLDGYQAHSIVSEVPYFTALGKCKVSGRHTKHTFSLNGKANTENPIIKGSEYFTTLNNQVASNEYYGSESFVDKYGRRISTEEGKLFVNDKIVLDTTDDKFIEV